MGHKVKTGILILQILLSYTLSLCQSPIFCPSRLNFLVGRNPWAVQTADFNEDGHLDMVTANFVSNTVTIRLGNGHGQFGDSSNFSVDVYPQRMAVADFNNDSHLDIAVTNWGDTTVSILLGRGDGTFQAQRRTGFGLTQSFLLADDFNNDGKIDLVVANRDPQTVTVRLGRGDGSFEAESVYSTASPNILADIRPWFMVSADFTGDGVKDLIIIHVDEAAFPRPKAIVLVGRPGGRFGNTIPIDISHNLSTAAVSVSIVEGDFNNDGKPDIAVGFDSLGVEGDVFTAFGNGNGTFQTGLPLLRLATKPLSIATADLDHDSHLDLLALNAVSARVSVHPGNGDGTFRNSFVPDSPSDFGYRVNYGSRWIALGDFDENGKVDILTANELNNSVSVLLAKTDTTFFTCPSFGVGSPPQAFPYDVLLADFDQDGILDLGVANWGFPNQPSNVSVLKGIGNGTFQEKVNYSVGINPTGLVAGDFNHDTYPDIAIVNGRGSSVSVLLNQGNGTFQDAVTYALDNMPPGSLADIDTGDVNRDGSLDLAVANTSRNRIDILLGRNDGTFQLPPISILSTDVYRVLIRDMNNDGNPDIVALDAYPAESVHNVSIHLGNGDGTFQLPHSLDLPGIYPSRMATSTAAASSHS